MSIVWSQLQQWEFLMKQEADNDDEAPLLHRQQPKELPLPDQILDPQVPIDSFSFSQFMKTDHSVYQHTNYNVRTCLDLLVNSNHFFISLSSFVVNLFGSPRKFQMRQFV